MLNASVLLSASFWFVIYVAAKASVTLIKTNILINLYFLKKKKHSVLTKHWKWRDFSSVESHYQCHV